jgi:hypothetical protein
MKFLEYLAKREREKIEREKEAFQVTLLGGETPKGDHCYTDIGHERDDLVILWTYNPKTGEFQTSDVGRGNQIYHHNEFKKWSGIVFAGRYSINDGRLSIYALSKIPNQDYILNYELLPILRRNFNFKKIFTFGD